MFDETIDPRFAWRSAGLRYNRQSHYYRRKFGCRVQKISLDGGFTCPNVDGTVAVGGCTFCDNRSFSPSRRSRRVPLREQFERSRESVLKRYGECKFLAYFQPATNTYASVERLQATFEPVLEFPDVLGLIIGTRPDCVPDPVLQYIEHLATSTYLCLEYGMQSMHDASLDWMNRGHHHACMVDAMERSRNRGFDIAAHVILGLPGETPSMMLDSVLEAVRLGVQGLKIHNLYAVDKTPLADQVRNGTVRLMELEEYGQLIIDILQSIPPEIVIERISGDAPPDFLIGPLWTLDKQVLMAYLDREMESRGIVQGCAISDADPKLPI